MNKFYLSEINIYPIKSLGGISLKEAKIEERGLQYDRRWMLIDEQGTFITQRKHFELALLEVSLKDNELTVTFKKNKEQKVSFSLEESIGESIAVTIWDDISNGFEVSKKVSDWFSDYMKMKVKLVKMSSEEKRLVDERYALDNEIVSFADGYPCLIIGQSSLDGLNEKLADPIEMNRFRPNFVFTGGTAHIEDSFSQFNLGNIAFSAVKPCARCVLITIDQQTGIKGHEPLKTLASYRTKEKKVLFGQNLIHKGFGIIRIGEELKIKEWR
ncbi:MOSC domain-containing protein [Pedobacter jamesrossensis]|uniref:MOSC domain-containing protein n=1 Tax=Pedobacter jamesrossensis TaxID=1908238 RepID=A0ABV8NP52_9SPHI